LRLLAYLWSRFESPRGALWVVVVGLLLAAPSLSAPLVADDLLHGSRVGAYTGLPGTHDAELPFFVFISGDAEHRATAMESGVLAWWTAKDAKVAFWRPVSAATHHLDYWLWPHQPVLMHVHSLLWFAALLIALSWLFRRLHPGPQGVLALALFAFDDARGFTIGFVSNRNALMAAVFGVCALIAYDRWRRDGWRAGAVCAPVLLLVGLLCAEMAVATTAFLFAYALFVDAGDLRRRIARLIPCAAVVVSWQLAYHAQGYGAAQSGIYVHPLGEPLQFAAKLVERVPVLALGQLGAPPSDAWLLLPSDARLGVYALALAVLVGMGWLLKPLLAQPLTKFWVLASALALVPISATFPSDRLLVFVGIGAAGALSSCFASAMKEPPRGWRRRAIGGLVLLHLVLAPLLLPIRSLTTTMVAAATEPYEAVIGAQPDIGNRSLVVVGAPTDGSVAYPVIHLAARDAPHPKNIRLLSTGTAAIDVTRLDEHTLRLRPKDGFYATEMEQMVRAPDIAFAVGDVVTLSDMRVTITEVDTSGRAMQADMRFVEPLESPRWFFTRGHWGGIAPWTPPAVGITETLR
jgi:hypothetical protein